LKALIEAGGIDEEFVQGRTAGWPDARDRAIASAWRALEEASGSTEARMRDFARLLMEKPDTVFVWSMGLTQHAHGVDTVRALINVALARGLFGREHCGVMPIRGHSGVQGGAEVGCAPGVNGYAATAMIDAAAAGAIDLFWIVGGNFVETLPRAGHVRTALTRPRLRIHQDIVLSSAMLVDPSNTVLVLPATTRYESPGGGTETSTERRIIFSPEISGRRIGHAMPEWWALTEAAARARPEAAGEIRFENAAAIRSDIANRFPLYAGIETLARKGDSVQWGRPNAICGWPLRHR
jgi:anaerobic selenocysteine-containing dehydrogenase